MVVASRSARASYLHWNLGVSEFLRSLAMALPVLAKFACGTSDNLVTTAILGPILTERYVPRTVSDLAERSEDALSAERIPVRDSSP